MTKHKSTKRALLLSGLALFACISMLVGSTFAWFTDSVTSKNNIIKSGNLDVELYYQVEGQTDWAKVDANTNVFMKDALWEPGHTEVVKLKVVNEGTLALKYQLGVNVDSEIGSVNVNGDPFKLSDYIKYGIVEGAQTYTRDAAVAAVDAAATALKTPYNKASALKAGEEVVVTMVVYMPTTVGNEANHAKGAIQPIINLGINLFATQYTYEEDSFGPDYDENAWHPDMVVTTAADLAKVIAEVKDGGIIALANDLTFDEDSATNSGGSWYEGLYYVGDKSFTIDLNGKTITNNSKVNDYLMLFKNDGDKANTITFKNGTLEATSSAYCALCTSTTSTQKITINLENVNLIGNNSNGAVAKIRGGAELNVKAGTVITGKNSYVGIECVNATVNIFDGAEIYQNGTSSYVGSLVGVSNNGTVNVYGGYGKSAQGGFIAMTSGGTINIYGGEWIANTDGAYANGNKSVLIAQSDKRAKSIINVYGGTFMGGYNCYGNVAGDAQINISAGTFNADPSAYVADGYKAVDVDGGRKMVINANYNYVADGVLASTDGKTYSVSNVAGYAWIDNQADNFFAGKTVELAADIDFAGETINSIKFWNPENKTIFDGKGHTLSNFVISNSDVAGLFRGTLNVKNLSVDKANVTGKYAGVIAGNMYGDIENCTVKNSVINGTYWQTGALAGQYNAGNVIDCVVDNCTINGMAAVGGLVGIVNETAGVRKIGNCTVKNTAIVQSGSFGGNYDDMFGIAAGLINTENATIYIDGCTFENNTLKGVASNDVAGVVEASNIVYVNGTIL